MRGRPPRLTREIYERVHAELLRGKTGGERLPTERELAQKFDASRDTIRAVMRILGESRAVVKRPNRGWFVGTPHTQRKEPLLGRQIGLSFSGGSYLLTDTFRMEVLSGLARRMHESGLNLLLCTRDWRWKEHRPPAAHFLWPQILGLFLFFKHPAWVFESYRTLSVPKIALDADYTAEGIHSVCFDNRHAGKLLAVRLHKLGHRRIAAIFEDPARLAEKRDDAWFERRAAFLAEAAGIGLPPPAEILLPTRENFLDGIKRLESLLSLPPAQRPTAVCVPHSGFLSPLRKSCAQLGLCVPRDLSVVGYRHVSEPSELTSICFDGAELGKAGILLMERMIESGKGRIIRADMLRVKGAYLAGQTHARAPQ